MDSRPTAADFSILALAMKSDVRLIEKDYYATRVLQHAVRYASSAESRYDLVFSGGTSLSKATKFIERFSEDIDFLTIRKDGQAERDVPRTERRAFRKAILREIAADPAFEITQPVRGGMGNIGGKAGSGFFSVDIDYVSAFEAHEALRGDKQRTFVQLEVNHERPLLQPKRTLVESLMSAAGGPEDGTTVLAVDPVEIAGTKITAISWRALRHRTDRPLGGAYLRHVHDVAALAETIASQPTDFVRAAQTAMASDIGRGRYGDWANRPPLARFEAAVQVLSQRYFREAYERFVEAVSYAQPAARRSYGAALGRFREAGALAFGAL